MSIDRFQPATLRYPALATATAARLGGRSLGRRWMQLVMLMLLVWAALFYSGIGNAMGAVRDVMANRIEARMLAQLRQSGTSQASRWGRAEPGAGTSACSVVSSPPMLSVDPFAAVLPLPDFSFEPAERRAEQSMPAGLPARAVPRWQKPLTRAPPFQAFQAFPAFQA